MKRLILTALTLALLLGLTACGSKQERKQYNEAMSLYEEGKYTAALKLFEEIPDYKKSDHYIRDCRYYAAMQTLSPTSNLQDGYSGTVVDCTADNANAYSQAVTMLEELDGYRDSNRMLKDAKKRLNQYNSENRMNTILTLLQDQFLGYVSRCEYEGNTLTLYLSDSYPVTFEVVKRGQTENAVRESWLKVRSNFTDTIFEYLPDCTVTIIDQNGDTIGTYLQGETGGEVTVLFDIATKPY